jgi:hypothetical protein
MMYKWNHDDEFHWDQMLNNQKSNLQNDSSFFNRHTVKDLIIFPLLGSLWFHVLFHSLKEVLFTFPSHYYFAISHPGIFNLARWSLLIHNILLMLIKNVPKQRLKSGLKVYLVLK